VRNAARSGRAESSASLIRDYGLDPDKAAGTIKDMHARGYLSYVFEGYASAAQKEAYSDYNDSPLSCPLTRSRNADRPDHAPGRIGLDWIDIHSIPKAIRTMVAEFENSVLNANVRRPSSHSSDTAADRL